MRIIESVPNISEGRDQEKIKRIMASLEAHKDINVIGCEPDKDYNRTVISLIGTPEIMIEALVDLTRAAAREIDLNHHSGQHPRMGAVDVIPLIPISGVTMKEAVDYARILGEKIAMDLTIPVFLYAEAATEEKRVNLPNIRKGEFEGMKEKIKDPEWKPDYGHPEIHPTFGAVAIGARAPLIAYNIDLDTHDEKLAATLARMIRKSNGGFQYIQAGPASLIDRGHVQVTMNILDYKKNPIYRIFELIKLEAKRYHVAVPSAEIVGLVPKEALCQSLAYYFGVESIGEKPEDLSLEALVDYAVRFLDLRDFSIEKIIESYL
jgi:glutamate formiminotransferase